MTVRRIPAALMRGGTSKGVFFRQEDLPRDPNLRDEVLLRVLGSPDPYGRQMDGMGGGYSSVSKVAILSRSDRPDCDIDYLFGQVAVDQAIVDWSGSCGNLIAAVGPFAIERGMVAAGSDGIAAVRIWQANLGQNIVAHVPMRDGHVEEDGDFALDGVAFPGAEIRVDYIGGASTEPDGCFPTGNVVDRLDVAGIGAFDVTLIDAGMPTVIVEAARLGLRGTVLPDEMKDAKLLSRLESIRAAAAVAMGLAANPAEATAKRPHSPKLAFVSPPVDYVASGGKVVAAWSIDLVARIVSMGKLHHAITATGAIAVAVAASIPGTVASRVTGQHGPTVSIGHSSGVFKVGAQVARRDGRWSVERVTMSRSARCLMDGWVCVPERFGAVGESW